MEDFKEVELPSGRTLQVKPASFVVSRTLYQTFVAEMKELKISGETEVDYNFFKDVACTLLASKKYEKELWECMKQCLIDNFKITTDSFEAIDHRDDYIKVIIEVSKENLYPFTKSLFAEFGHLFQFLK